MKEKAPEKISLGPLVIDWRANGGNISGESFFRLHCRHLNDSIGDTGHIRRLFCQIGIMCVKENESALSTMRGSNPS